MNKPALAAMLVLTAVGLCHAQVKLGDNATIVFANIDQGKAVLTAQDAFTRRLSPFDRAARMKTDRAVSEENFLKFIGENVLEWTEAERTATTSALETIAPQLTALSLPWPSTIYLIKTTGKEEGGAAYTRGNAIVLPVNILAARATSTARLICHELFHILSRHNPILRDRLYEVIGFEKCNEIEWPETLVARRLTNPDAPMNDHYIKVSVGREPALAVPILFSRTEKYDVERGGSFFDYLQFRFLLVEREEDLPNLKPIYDGDSPRLVNAGELQGFWEQVGRNTQYIYHPEEILADNFALLVIPRPNIPSPEIIEKIKAVLSEETATDAVAENL